MFSFKDHDFYDENNSGDNDNNQGLGKGNEGEREEEEDSMEFSTDHGVSPNTDTYMHAHSIYSFYLISLYLFLYRRSRIYQLTLSPPLSSILSHSLILSLILALTWLDSNFHDTYSNRYIFLCR